MEEEGRDVMSWEALRRGEERSPGGPHVFLTCRITRLYSVKTLLRDDRLPPRGQQLEQGNRVTSELFKVGLCGD